ncbi:MAG: flavin-containing monooxygenase [Hyphomicrobiaceae bacterium]
MDDGASSSMGSGASEAQCDAVIVGAGFAGMYLLHRLRQLGLATRVLEAASGVGGTWYWNRYPGARCDVESMQYSFSFSPELQQEWQWSEVFSAQPEILEYANHVADRFDLRRDIEFNTTVVAARFDETARRWLIETDRGGTIASRFCIMATGCLSSARVPDFEGLSEYAGQTYHTGYWPHEPVSFTGKRVAVIGTGSSAIQAIPVIAEQADHLTVFQRTPNYSIPSRNGPMPADYEQSWKEDYVALREKARRSRNGILSNPNDQSALEVDDTEREAVYEARWEVGGTSFMAAFNNLISSAEANETCAEFVRDKIRATVKDPEAAELLAAKDYPIGTKRICVDTRYFETYNRPNVALIDIRDSPIERLTQEGLHHAGIDYSFDAIVFATGFDAMTGTLDKIDIRGRKDIRLRDEWTAGPRTYLGMMSAGFPNLFMITGPQSPSVLSNMMVSIEQHVGWMTDCIAHMRAASQATIEPTSAAQDGWVEHNDEVAHKTLYPRAASWYMGANIPGKPRVFLPYIGGVGAYREKCAEVAENNYEGFEFEALKQPAAAAE